MDDLIYMNIHVGYNFKKTMNLEGIKEIFGWSGGGWKEGLEDGLTKCSVINIKVY